jgi:hypothetical protein
MFKSPATPASTVPSIGDRLQAARAALVTAIGLVHAANSIGDLGIPNGNVDASDLTARAAVVALNDADEQLYCVIALADLGGDRAVLDTPAPNGDQAIAMGRDYLRDGAR